MTVRVQHFTTDDGRKAERHISTDEQGNETIEVFAEEKRPLKLEKRIHREFKNTITKETHETVKDGEVAHVETKQSDIETPLRGVERIGVANHAKIVDGDYVRKEEIAGLIEQSVQALIENGDVSSVPVSAQGVVEAEKKQGEGQFIWWLAGFVVVQMLAKVYYFLFC